MIRRGGADGEDAFFGALDVGAGKVACLIGAARVSQDPDGPIDILGAHLAPVRRDDDETRRHMARVALDQALRMAGDAAAPFGAAYGGPDLLSLKATGTARLSGPVGPRDVAAAVAAARSAAPLQGRRLLHAAPIAYRIDGGAPVADPRGAVGERLAVDLCLTHAPAAAVAELEQTLASAGAAPAFVVAAPFAAGYGVLDAEERAAGAAVVDLGEWGATIAVFGGGALIHAEAVPGGGARLTRDLAVRLNTSVAVAERAKRLHGGLCGEGEPTDAIEVPVIGEDGRLEPGLVLREAFAEALMPRLEEIFARIGARLDGVGEIDTPVTLTGGVSHTPGLRPLVARLLKRPVKIGAPVGFGGFDAAQTAGSYAVAAGLLRCGLERAALAAPRATGGATVSLDAHAMRRTVGGALTWFKENF